MGMFYVCKIWHNTVKTLHMHSNCLSTTISLTWPLSAQYTCITWLIDGFSETFTSSAVLKCILSDNMHIILNTNQHSRILDGMPTQFVQPCAPQIVSSS